MKEYTVTFKKKHGEAELDSEWKVKLNDNGRPYIKTGSVTHYREGIEFLAKKKVVKVHEKTTMPKE
ncbi:hypothetical protein CL622_01905 [archaeon]|nr:hypothetical protein [archaeon]